MLHIIVVAEAAWGREEKEMSIKVEKIQNGFSISFPFELKNKFREAFPSAKWDAKGKVWTVGPRSGGRLEQWVALVDASGAVEEIEHRDEREMTEKEVNSLQADLAEIKERIKDSLRGKDTLEELREIMGATLDALQKNSMKLAEIKRDSDKIEAEMVKRRNATESTLRQYIDLDAILAAQRKMIAVAKAVGSTAREDWNQGQEVMQKASVQLKEAGMMSYGINKLATANHNRPDRDHPGRVTIEQILNIIEIDKG